MWTHKVLGLGDPTLSNCTIQAGVSYCVDFTGDGPPDAVDANSTLPIRVCIDPVSPFVQIAEIFLGRSRGKLHPIQ
jgi:hypothetical protein